MRAMRPDDARQVLSGIRQRLADQRRLADEEAQRRRLEEAARERDARLFRAAVGETRPLAPRDRRPPVRTGVAPLPRPREPDPRNAPAPALSDGADVPFDGDQMPSYFRPGAGSQAVRRLRRGEWRVEAHLDLHGMNRDQARTAVGTLLANATSDGLRCVRIVHGKGLGSSDRAPVLATLTRRWLLQSASVIAFTQARAVDGGAGALLVLLAGKPL